MRQISFILLLLNIYGCHDESPTQSVLPEIKLHPINDRTYEQIKDSVAITRKLYSSKYSSRTKLNAEEMNQLRNFWVDNIGTVFFEKWKNTPWDYNGITEHPGEGAIACGYFVTTVLRDMDLTINRSKLAICPSSVMMKSLTPGQKIKNLSQLSYSDFNEELKHFGKGVYIIGLDFHTGFIVNDGTENWFIHSLFLNRRGVVKEAVSNSWALSSTKTRWLVSLTGDQGFLFKWLKRS